MYLGTGLLDQVHAVVAHHATDRATVVVTDDNVERELQRWERDANHPWRSPDAGDPPPLADGCIAMAPGETSKTREQWNRLTDELLDRGHRRDSVVIAIGGGVVGDLAGFVAATYMRGIPIIHVPTTLVAMVDSSIGGKTGVDTEAGKNLVGAFHQPTAIVTDPRCLLTLPDEDLRAGLGEAVKHAVLADAEYFDWLERHAAAILDRDLEVLTRLVHDSVRIKADVVERDERDEGRRAHLNLGHTVAHALEHASAYRISHGAAVALGVVAEAYIAEELGLVDSGVPERIEALLTRLGPTTTTDAAALSSERVIAAMGYDKKSSTAGEALHFALPTNVGTMSGGPGRWTTPVADVALVRRALLRIGISSQ